MGPITVPNEADGLSPNIDLAFPVTAGSTDPLEQSLANRDTLDQPLVEAILKERIKSSAGWQQAHSALYANLPEGLPAIYAIFKSIADALTNSSFPYNTGGININNPLNMWLEEFSRRFRSLFPPQVFDPDEPYDFWAAVQHLIEHIFTPPGNDMDPDLSPWSGFHQVVTNLVNGFLGVFGLEWSQADGLRAIGSASDALVANSAALAQLIAQLSATSVNDDFERPSDSNLGVGWAVTFLTGDASQGTPSLDGHNAYFDANLFGSNCEYVCRYVGPNPNSATDSQRNSIVLSTTPTANPLLGGFKGADTVWGRVSGDNRTGYKFEGNADRTCRLVRYNDGVPTVLASATVLNPIGPGTMADLYIGNDTQPGYLRVDVANSTLMGPMIDPDPITGAANRGRGFGGISHTSFLDNQNGLPGKVNQFIGIDFNAPAIEDAAPLPMGPPGDWTLDFEDTFSGSSLDTTKWNNAWHREPVLNGVFTSPSRVTISGGALRLRLSDGSNGAAVTTDPEGPTTGGYRIGLGIVQARIAFPGNGSQIYNWPAFWTDGRTNAVAWPTNGENDIAEGTMGGGMQIGYHSDPSNDLTYPVPGYYGGDFHTYTLHRKAGSCDVYFDGVLMHSYATNDGDADQFIVINVGSVFFGVPAYGAASDVLVDYVRAWV